MHHFTVLISIYTGKQTIDSSTILRLFYAIFRNPVSAIPLTGLQHEEEYCLLKIFQLT